MSCTILSQRQAEVASPANAGSPTPGPRRHVVLMNRGPNQKMTHLTKNLSLICPPICKICTRYMSLFTGYVMLIYTEHTRWCHDHCFVALVWYTRILTVAANPPHFWHNAVCWDSQTFGVEATLRLWIMWLCHHKSPMFNVLIYMCESWRSIYVPIKVHLSQNTHALGWLLVCWKRHWKWKFHVTM